MKSAYDLPPPRYKAELTEVRKGTPMGELLRRYWHPIGLGRDAGSRPRRVKALAEDLILFRDGEGRPGLLHFRCAHRGASLYYGRVEPTGIRCCYHGWLFDVTGACLEQPCEPNRMRVQQPAYPVQELYGLIFAYLGPPRLQPVLPRYQLLESLGPDETIEADDSSIGSGGPTIVPCNWLQHFENVMDPLHVPVLHGSFSGAQFTAEMELMPKVTFETTPRGVLSIQDRDLGDGRIHRRVTEAVVPSIRAVASPRATSAGSCSLLGWVLPLDDTSFRIYTAGRVTRPGELASIRSTFNGRPWHELTDEEHRDYPGDYEAQVGQGPISLHSEEHLATSDRGVALVRRALRTQLAALAKGRNPVGVSFDSAAPPIRLEAGTEIFGNRRSDRAEQ